MDDHKPLDPALERAMTLALRHLSRRERSVSELRRHLLARDLESDVVDAAVAELADRGYVDDARYAELYVHDKRALDQWGADRIRRELLTRGIDRELVEAALARGGPDEELERARAVVRRRFPGGARGRDRERALGVLLRKGFGYELAAAAVAQAAQD